VRGGGKKPFRQKGRGVARQGTSRSPLFPGGSTIFGPQPHLYSVKIPIKVKRLARASALVLKMKSEGIRVVEDFSMNAAKTSEIVSIFKALGVDDQKILLLTTEFDQTITRSVRNLPRATAQKAANASTRELMDCSTIVLQQSAVEKLVGVLTNAA
jgi:large subunit ribosomal protein L4